MDRRAFLGTVAGGLLAAPLAAGAQQSPVVGFLHSGPASSLSQLADAFRRGLAESGYVEGQNVSIEYRWAEGQYDRLAGLAADLVRRPVAVILGGGPPAALAAKAATRTIPVVFVSGDDPIKSNLVERLNRPGGNVTGISVFSGSQLGTKHIGLLHELVPAATVIALLVNPTNSKQTEAETKLVEPAARALGVRLHVVNASNESAFSKAFAILAKQRAGALIVGADAMFVGRRNQLVALAERYAIPAIYEFREYAVIGGLMSYGPNLQDGYRQAGIYTGRILKGEKPGELPVVLPTQFELVINLKTAKALNLAIPPSLLGRADELIQ